ncbi:acetolactate decarboxylase [Desulfovibrio ferrophilus]|uniref:Alpha-acetolactate decarboxylase n=1 Tax=Desulfovibrio ferrophilus TaxID=241368 RepID=A0A2Z6B3K0_9BACT|nr:acetolactate decarboxylase [Desulfovibrio ferrophilus]BBD10033.1 alpha-acetolactate decarboxylase [Desulfovibrio ferrophilus]
MKRTRLLLKIILGVVLYALAVLTTAAAVKAEQGTDTLFQVSTIDALLDGVYDGAMPVTQLTAKGNAGLGTFHALDGEMAVIDGIVYQVRADGSVRVAQPEASTPFAAVTPFEADFELTLGNVASMRELTSALESLLPNPNIFYAIRATGRFSKVKTRSVPRQEKPYPPLKVVAANQPVFHFADVPGDIVGFWSPAFVKGVGVPGFHLHFLNAERTGGGHMLDCSFENLTLTLDATPAFTVVLPQSEDFATTDLARDRAEDLHKVEK